MAFEYRALHFAELVLRISCLLLGGAKESSQWQPEAAGLVGLSSSGRGTLTLSAPFHPFLRGNLSYHRKWLHPGVNEHRA